MGDRPGLWTTLLDIGICWRRSAVVMDREQARIEVRSRRQAMDWSLVLISQGIESTIEYNEEGGWGLLVSAVERERASQVIRLYESENRRWPWRQELFHTGALFDWGSLAWVMLVCVFWMADGPVDLHGAGLMDSVAVGHGQWWRLFTAIWLHGDIGHLATNATLGVVLLGLTMGRYGTGLGLLLAYLAGFGGNLLEWLLALAPRLSLGASGMVMGCLGLLAIHSFALWRQTPHSTRYVVSSLLAGVMLFVLFGLAPGSDVLAHAGGFLTGLLLGTAVSWAPKLAQKQRLNLLSGLVFTLLVVIPWWLALRRGATS
jgi:rhomboid protease GluP